jgi:2-phosphoglycolate phosphatase
MTIFQSLLFDLDGTLLDTAPDMAATLNQLLTHYHLPELSLEQIRPVVSHGARALLQLGFKNAPSLNTAQLLEDFLLLYQHHATNTTQLFPGMDTVLHYLETHHIPWGIVTNKPSRFTFDILKKLNLLERAACTVCGDTLQKRKPDPAPIIHACQLLKQQTKDCLYVGDSKIDVLASRAAGTLSLVALYGYIGVEEDPFSWRAEGYVKEPLQIIDWIQQCAHVQSTLF